MASLASLYALISSTGEASWATTGAASKKLHGVTAFTATINEVAEAVRSVGTYGPGTVMDEVSQSAEFNIEGVWTYEEAPKLLNMLFTYTSASTSVALPATYHWTAPITSTQVCMTSPIEFGLGGVAANTYVALGGVLNGLTLSGEAGSYWKYTAPGLAKGIETRTSGYSTAAYADSRVQTAVAMQDTNIRFSPFATGAYGTSSGQITASLISFELAYDPARHTKLFAGSKWAGNWGDAPYNATLRTVLEFGSTSKAVLDELLGSSTGVALQRQIQIYASKTDSTGGTSGLVSSIDFNGMVSSPITLWGDRDGNATVEINWAAKLTTAMDLEGSSGTGNALGFRLKNSSLNTS